MVSSANQSSRSISPSSPHWSTMRSISAAIVAAWPRMNLSRSAWLWSASAALLGRGVEHHALAEDRRHERVGRGLVELLLGRPEEHLVGLGAR